MATARHLRSIASGLLGTFVSRNNDIGGYWGMGVLKKLAVDNGVSRFLMDLSHRPGESAEIPIIARLEERYRKRLIGLLDCVGGDVGELDRADIQIQFYTFEEYPNAIRDTRGEPYVCSVLLTTKNGKSYRATKLGVCAQHNPLLDRKRANDTHE